MYNIMEFSPEVCAELRYYVYRLIDPRNGHTFYVGQGKGNRVFQHVQCAIDYYSEAKDINDDDPNKLKIINSIRSEGLEVIHVIHRWNLSKKEALEVEAALIDAFPGLANLQSGYHSDFGVTNAQSLQNVLSLTEYEEPESFKYLIIKVKQWRLDELLEKYPRTNRYEATRYAWRITPRSIKEYPYVLSVTDGIVKEVYKIEKWYKVPERSRYAFEGSPAEVKIREQFVGHRIPQKYCKKGMASPVLFSKNM